MMYRATNEMISVVVPCFNEQEALPSFISELNRVAINMESEFSQLSFEVILVNDGSTDDTLTIIKKYLFQDLNLKIHFISFSRNFGKEAALLAGLRFSSGDLVAVMDADMQDPPAMLKTMYLELCQSGCDQVAACRTNRVGESAIRSWFARLFYRLINKISDTNIADGARDFRLMTRQVVDSVLSLSERNRFSKGIFDWVGFRTHWVKYENIERVAGSSKWSFWQLMHYATEGITAFSEAPLQIASIAGIVMFIFSLLSVAIIAVRASVFGDPVAGWPSLACIILFVGGIQLMCLGVVGRYLANVYVETKARPLYLVAETDLSKDFSKSN